MDEQFYLNNLWRKAAGMKEIELNKSGHGLIYLRATQWSDKFETLMRNRLIVGAMRYGLLNQAGKPQYDRPADIRRRIDEYIKTGNVEILVDIANLSLCEFVEGKHPKRHIKTMDDTEHTKEL